MVLLIWKLGLRYLNLGLQLVQRLKVRAGTHILTG